MNRAWIPAGALAGVSVAGLIALGQLTSSLDSKVDFQPTLTVAASSSAHKGGVVQVSLDLGAQGNTNTDTTGAEYKVGRGGEATSSVTSGDAGEVGYKRTPSTSATTSTTATPQKAKPKKTAPRKTSIGADSGPNGDNGLAGGSSGGPTNTGATSGTPAP
jgi:hypothetical protein